MTLRNEIIQGDCIRVLKSLPAAVADLVVTDPPYLVGYKDRAGRTIANDESPESVLGCFPELFRVMKPDSICICFYGWSRIDLFSSAWREAGFTSVGHIVWPKEYSSSKGFVKSSHEQAYILAKGRPQKPASPLPDVQPWEYTGNRFHPTEKAVSILEPLICSFTQPGQLVLDPFAGSGSTLVAAALSGRDYFGIELEQKYCELARRRLSGVARYLRLPAAA